MAVWNQATDELIQSRRATEAIPRIRTILKKLPRHLPSYFRLLQSIWLLRRWDEGQDWALRLLRADPCSELAWGVLANGAEQRDNLPEARRYWQRALENAPYNQHIRAGMVRTTPGKAEPLQLTQAALATLCRLDGRWLRAVKLYTSLHQESPHRADLQSGLLESLWRAEHHDDALSLAARMVHREPSLLIGWIVSTLLGDRTDQALAQAPLAALDADGEYMTVRFGVTLAPNSPTSIGVSSEEARWLDR